MRERREMRGRWGKSKVGTQARVSTFDLIYVARKRLKTIKNLKEHLKVSTLGLVYAARKD